MQFFKKIFSPIIGILRFIQSYFKAMIFILILFLLFAPNSEQDLTPNNLQQINLVGPIMEVSEVLEQIEKDITLEEYLRTNGVAEGEVKKWVEKYNIPISNHYVKDKIFYWDDFDFYDYKLFSEFKMFISKNTQTDIWVNNETICEQLGENLRIVFHGFEDAIGEVKIKINGIWYSVTPKPFEFEEFPVSSQEINELIFEYNGKQVDYTKDF